MRSFMGRCARQSGPDVSSVWVRVPIEMITAGFNGKRPILFYTDSVVVQEHAILGFYTAQDSRTFQSGSGGDLALAWLNFREQSPFMSSQRTVYLLLEAKRFGEQNPTVGNRSILFFMTPSQTSPPLTFFVLISAAIFALIMLLVRRHNHTAYAQRYAQWDQSFICQRCGTLSQQELG